MLLLCIHIICLDNSKLDKRQRNNTKNKVVHNQKVLTSLFAQDKTLQVNLTKNKKKGRPNDLENPDQKTKRHVTR